jgi:hypothetical protein
MKLNKVKANYDLFKNFAENNKSLFYIWGGLVIGLLLFSDLSITSKVEGFASINTVDINFNQNVIVKRLHKNLGEVANKGDLLIEFENKELQIEIEKKKNDLAELESKLQLVSGEDFKEIHSSIIKNIDLLKQEVSNLKLKESNLRVYAQYDCIISNIYFSKGEYVSAFTDIISVQKEKTKIVNAFIPENERNKFTIGQSVLVESLDHQKVSKGKVILLSAEVQQAPERLNSFSLAKEWGSKLVVELEESVFKRGEKITIQPISQKKISLFSNALATPKEIKNLSRLNNSPTELSAIVKLNDQYLLTAGDEGKEIEDTLRLYSPATNRFEKIEVVNNREIEDIESLFIANDFIYAVASQSEDKDGDSKADRNKVIKFKYLGGKKFEVIKVIEVREKLIDSLKKTDLADLIDFDDFEIEASEYFSNELYFILKNPTKNSQIVILTMSLANLENEMFDSVTYKTIATPNNLFKVTSLRKVTNKSLILILNDDKTSKVFKSDLGLSHLTLMFEEKQKLEGVERFGNNLFLVSDKKNKGGEIFISPIKKNAL